MVFLRMRWVVFLRAVNVGGANRCQPALIAKELAKFGVVNIGAVGTFVVREDVSEPVLRTAIAKKLPFKCEIMICPARDLINSHQRIHLHDSVRVRTSPGSSAC